MVVGTGSLGLHFCKSQTAEIQVCMQWFAFPRLIAVHAEFSGESGRIFMNWNVGPFNLELTTNKNFVQRSTSVDPNLHGSENLLGYWISDFSVTAFS